MIINPCVCGADPTLLFSKNEKFMWYICPHAKNSFIGKHITVWYGAKTEPEAAMKWNNAVLNDSIKEVNK